MHARILIALSLLGGIILAPSPVAHAKSSQTFYTPARIAVGRENVKRHDWAKAQFARIMNGEPQTYIIGREYVSAKEYAAQSDEFMWLLQPTTRLPRVSTHETMAECPIHGTDVRKINAFHPWRIDPIRHPYQIQCALGKEWYPSNDWVNGDMTSGEFPDDGNGILHEGRRFYMLREYAHAAYCAATIPCLRALSQAWVLTGDPQYAHKCGVLLTRLASEYPNHDDRKDRLYLAPYGGRHPHYTWKTGGMITDLIWETFCTEAAVLAYDAIYDYLGQDEALIQFVRGKGVPVETADDLRRYIEKYILKAAAVGLLNGDIHGNEGHHQALAMTIALVLDDYTGPSPNSLDMLEYTYHGEGRAAYMLANGLYRDGGGHESPNYNAIKFDFIRVARLMEQARALHPDLLPVDRYPDIFAEAKGRAMFDYFIDVMVMDTFTPSIGDCAGRLVPARVKPDYYSYVGAPNLYAFERFGDPKYARASTRPNGTMIAGELFEEYPAEALEAAVAGDAGQIVRRSRLLDDYGAAFLESGEGDHRRAVVLNYAATPGHRQQDNLNLEFFARGIDLLPDLGYPFSWDYRWEWDANIMAHNTVSVGETHADIRQRLGNESSLFVSESGVHAIVAHHNPYPTEAGLSKAAAPGVDLYERTVLLVDIDPERFYVVDLFAVNGGDQRDQTWHGPLVSPKSPDLDWEVQETGTLAGPDVPQFAKYKDRWGREWVNFPSFVRNIRRARLDAPALWTWDYGMPEKDRLNLHVIPLGGPLEAIMGTGRSPARPEDWGLDYLFLRRMAEVPERSLFLTVLDAYQGDAATVTGVRVISQDPLEIEVSYQGGSDRVCIGTPAGPSLTTAYRKHGIRVVSTVNGETRRDVQAGHWAPGQGPGYAHAELVATDCPAQKVAIPYSEALEAICEPGRAVRIFNERRTAMFRVVETAREDDRLWLKLDTSALLARGPVIAVEDGVLEVGAHFTLSTGGVDAEGKLLEGRHLYFAGSRLGEGDEGLKVRGTWRKSGSETRVFVEGADRESLERVFLGRMAYVWQYGVGDTLEVVRVEADVVGE